MTAIRLDYHPRAWQRECHLKRRRFTVLALHRRAGKTELAIMELIDKCLKCKAELGFFVYVAPFLKQAKAIAWARLKQKLLPMRQTAAIDINEADLAVTFKHNGATIRLFGGDNPDALRGVRLDGCVIDEVAQIRPEVWNDIIQPALSDRQGWAMFIGTLPVRLHRGRRQSAHHARRLRERSSACVPRPRCQRRAARHGR